MDKFTGSFFVKWFISENDFNNSIDHYKKYFGVEKSLSFLYEQMKTSRIKI